MTTGAGLRHLPQGPSPVGQTLEDVFIPRPAVSTETVKNVVFKLVTKGKGDVYLPLYQQNIVRGYKKDNDGKEDKAQPILDTIRVLKGVYTIWESEQKDIKMDAKSIAKARRSIKFEWMGKDNVALVKSDDVLALEALRILKHNIEVPGHEKGSRFAYYEVNTQRQAEEMAKARQQRREAVRTAEGQKLEQIKKHAIYLGIRLFDEYGQEKVEKALRNEYEDYAEFNYDIFLKTVKSPDVEIAYLISKAISEAKIDISTHKGSAYWPSGGFICKIPQGQNATKYLTEFALMLGEDSKAFKQQLETLGK